MKRRIEKDEKKGGKGKERRWTYSTLPRREEEEELREEEEEERKEREGEGERRGRGEGR